MANAVKRMPKRSRMRAAKPLPVTAPIFAAVSSTKTSMMHMRGMTQRVANPKFAPAVE